VFVDAASKITVPTLLVRGQTSELVGEEHAREFLELVPHSAYVDVSGAGHMVAGDRNDVFAEAVLDFLNRLEAA
jgi:pimeloyl-ACP methyl ester carboxylesterase